MKVILTLKNIASGPYYLVSGKTRPDKYRFVRNPKQRNLHELVIDSKSAPKVLDDLALRTQQTDIPVGISFQVEEADLDAGGALTAKDVTIAQCEIEIKNLRQLVRNADVALNERQTKAHGKRITDKELEMLKERDELLEVLKPFAGPDEMPVAVLLRLANPAPTNISYTTSPPEAVAPPAMAEAEPSEEPAKPPAGKKARKTTG
jgi:hypothetical protein